MMQVFWEDIGYMCLSGHVMTDDLNQVVEVIFLNIYSRLTALEHAMLNKGLFF